jgi:serine/threonine protein phosphatase PrpC
MAIADGVGGAPGGDIAAEIAIQTLRESTASITDLDAEFLKIARAMDKKAKQSPELDPRSDGDNPICRAAGRSTFRVGARG